jgi:hypothetical protein
MPLPRRRAGSPASRARLRASLGQSTQPETDGSPPGYTLAGTGDVHDFDYFAGAWTTHQRRLKQRGVGSNEWEEFPATLCMSLYSAAWPPWTNLLSTKGWSGLTLRTFELAKAPVVHLLGEQCHAESSETPVFGGFQGSTVRFYGEDQDNGRR